MRQLLSFFRSMLAGEGGECERRRHRRAPKSSNLISLVHAMRTHGRTVRPYLAKQGMALHKFAGATLYDKNISPLLSALDALQDLTQHAQLATCHESVDRLDQLVMDAMVDGPEVTTPEFTHSAVQGGMASSLKHVLYLTLDAAKSTDRRARSTHARQMLEQTQHKALTILRDLCMASLEVATALAADHAFIRLTFHFMPNPTLYEVSVSLAEEVMGVTMQPFDLTSVERLDALVKSLDTRGFALFCRMLALVVFEPDDRSLEDALQSYAAEDLLAMRAKEQRRNTSVADANHNLLLNQLDILGRTVELIRLRDHIPPLLGGDEDGGHASSMAQLFESLMLGSQEHAHAHDHAHAHAHAHGHGHGNHDNRERSLSDQLSAWHALTLISHQVEAIFVLCRLLSGKYKLEVQERLMKLGIADVLCDMFDTQLTWSGPSLASALAEPLHGHGCECDPESALRLQFLRLVHALCDRDTLNPHTSLLLSERERKSAALSAPNALPPHPASIRPSRVGLSPLASPPAPWRSPKGEGEGEGESESEGDDDSEGEGEGEGEGEQRRERSKRNKTGLMMRVVGVLLDNQCESSIRFWATSCIEAFLRTCGPTERLFLSSCGIVQYLVNDIVEPSVEGANHAQHNFDLLGELVKNNAHAIHQLNTLLVHDAQFQKFTQAMLGSLVDSNVFIRSLLLSLERLGRLGDGSALSREDAVAQEVVRHSKLIRFVERQQMTILQQLMSCVQHSEVSLDNLCCVNTCVVFFLLAHRHKHLDACVKSLVEVEGDAQSKLSPLDNFLKLLEFWETYYRYSDKDRRNLSFSSGLAFEELGEVVVVVRGSVRAARVACESRRLVKRQTPSRHL